MGEIEGQAVDRFVAGWVSLKVNPEVVFKVEDVYYRIPLDQYLGEGMETRSGQREKLAVMQPIKNTI